MPHSSKKYRKPERPSGSGSRALTYVVVAVIVAIVAAGAGWYAYSTFGSTARSIMTTTTTSPIIYAKIFTPMGVMEVELYASLTPKTVANFVDLAKSGFYNDLTWHRIVKGFVIQTGDPTTKNGGGVRSTWGQHGSNQTVPLEIVPSLHNTIGTLGMARTSDPNSGSSQFYINLANNTNLDGQYTVFGKVISGMNVAQSIANVPTYPESSAYPDQPINPILLTNVTILNSGP
ncbi:MAG TPA: peptidylprolyl isomerase [Nitrososphaerales archaeon]|nr:peptidylprolyl isomerase [Nitrososphaerales archaeon]